jgi:hypothetical protein
VEGCWRRVGSRESGGGGSGGGPRDEADERGDDGFGVRVRLGDEGGSPGLGVRRAEIDEDPEG